MNPRNSAAGTIRQSTRPTRRSVPFDLVLPVGVTRAVLPHPRRGLEWLREHRFPSIAGSACSERGRGDRQCEEWERRRGELDFEIDASS